MSAAAYQQVRWIIENYFAYLDRQANGRWQSLPDLFVRNSQAFYSVDLRAVRFASGINTGDGSAVTVGNKIYFPREINLDDKEDTMWMLHELEHVVQYARRGGIDPMMGEYVLKHVGKILQTGRVNVHDLHDMERAADAKAANSVAGIYGWNLIVTNSCPFAVDVAFSWQNTASLWTTAGYWRAQPGQKYLLADEQNSPVHTRNGVVYFYAEAADGAQSASRWGGNTFLVVPTDNRRLGFFETRLSQGARDFDFLVTSCN